MLTPIELNSFRITAMTARDAITSATLAVVAAARSSYATVCAFCNNPVNQRRARITARLVGYSIATALLWTAWCLQHLGIALNDWADNIRDIEAYDRSVSRAIPSWDSDADPTGGDRQPDIIDQAADTPAPQEVQEAPSPSSPTQEVIDYLVDQPGVVLDTPATKTRRGSGNGKRSTGKTSTAKKSAHGLSGRKDCPPSQEA